MFLSVLLGFATFGVTLCVAIDPGASTRKEIPYNKAFPSPNGQYVAQRIDGSTLGPVRSSLEDQADQITIRATQTGQVDWLECIDPLWVLRWTKNSKTFVIVTQPSGGTHTSVCNFDGVQWIVTETELPIRPVHVSSVIQLEMGIDTIVQVCTMEKEYDENGRRLGTFYKCKFISSATTGKVLKFISSKKGFPNLQQSF